jgi:hypothetical protein
VAGSEFSGGFLTKGWSKNDESKCSTRLVQMCLVGVCVGRFMWVLAQRYVFCAHTLELYLNYNSCWQRVTPLSLQNSHPARIRSKYTFNSIPPV